MFGTTGNRYYYLNCNAENFVERAKNAGLKTGSTPRRGAIMCWQKGSLASSDGAGHVAIVEQVYDNNHDKDEWFDVMKDTASKLGFCTNMKEYKENKENYVGSIADFSDIIRICVTNRHNTPDIYSIMQILGKIRVDYQEALLLLLSF